MSGNAVANLSGGNLGLQIALGHVDGVYPATKFGRNIEVDAGVTADVWDGGHTVASGGTSLVWVAPTAARQHTIASTSASDTDGGVGARTVRIYGLTSWDSEQVTEDVTLNTSSPPVTIKSYVIIYAMAVLTKGATNVNVGEITATAATDSTVTARIRAGQGQTQMAIYGVPSTQSLYISSVYASYNKAGGNAGSADIALLINPEPDDELLNFLSHYTWDVMSVGTSVSELSFNPPKKIPGPAIVKIQVSSSANDADISAGFNGILADNV